MKPKSLEIFVPGPAGRLEAKYYKSKNNTSPVKSSRGCCHKLIFLQGVQEIDSGKEILGNGLHIISLSTFAVLSVKQ